MPGSHDWRNRAASQIAQPLPDNTADVLTVLNPRAAGRRMWSNGEYERALDLINQGYDKLIVAQMIDRTLAQLKSKLCYEQMEDGKRQQRREQINELRKRALNTPDRPRKNFRVQHRGIELAPANVLEERTARQAAEYRDRSPSGIRGRATASWIAGALYDRPRPPSGGSSRHWRTPSTSIRAQFARVSSLNPD